MSASMNRPLRLTVGCWMCLAAAWPLPALAVGASYWTQTNEADFKGGKLENVVATNLGDLKLSSAVKTIMENDPRISAVNALAEGPDGTIYAATGPGGVLLSIKEDQVKTVAVVKDAPHLFALAVDKEGRLLIGVGGEHGRVLRIDKPGDEPKEIFKADGVQYVWAVKAADDGSVYAATGPTGKLFEIKSDGSTRVLLDADETNLLSLAYDGGDLLYVGTDPNGLVYRVNRKTGESYVLLDAAEAEVSSLALDKQGNLYAGTSEAREDPPTPPPAAPEVAGRPEAATTGVPIASPPPTDPKPPEPPAPDPGQPKPIPRVLSMIQRAVRTALPNLAKADGGGTPQPAASASKPETAAATPQAPARPVAPARQPRTAPGRPPAVDAAAAGQPRPDGNAVYRIDKDGFVTEIFRQRALMLSMVERDGQLLVGTGSEGVIYQIRPAAEETVVVAKVDPKQVLSLLTAKDGRVYAGLANAGGVATLSGGYAQEGTFTSVVLDATQISRFGNVRLSGTLPGDTSLTVSTRSGNVKEPSETSWSAWSSPAPAAEFIHVDSPPARYFQYRLNFTSSDGKATPAVEEVAVSYQLPNLPPQVKAIRVTPSADAINPADVDAVRVAPIRKHTVSWDAADANSDRMEYALYYRRGSTGPWALLKDKLTTPTFEWDTRSVADGRYELKVQASDAPSNPPGAAAASSRVSDAVVIDNTPPVIGDLASHQNGDAVTVEAKIVDRMTTVAALDFAIDGSRDWQLALPSDTIFDSPVETVSFRLPGLSPGDHQVSLRATDAKGNTVYENTTVTVEAPAKQ